MGRYLLLQFKRLLRHLPGALLALAVLAGGGFLALTAMTQPGARDEKVRIAMVGTAEDTILQMGMAAVSSVDATRFTLELVELPDEAAARQALQRGEVAAFVVLPENFMEEAMAGNIQPIRLVTTPGAGGMVSIFKEEVSRVISQVLVSAQKGVYGMQQAMRDHDIGNRGETMTYLAIRYVDYVLARDQVYRVESLGIADQLPLERYLLCGFAVVLLHLCCLPFAPMVIRRDLSLARMLAAKGRSVGVQTLCDLLVYALGILVLALPLTLVEVPLPQALPVVLLVAAFSYMLYALTADLISGVLLQFFLSVAMCFVSGCLYPVFFFPGSVQRLAAWLPAGLARSQLAGGEHTLWLLGYALVFALVAVLARTKAVKEARL